MTLEKILNPSELENGASGDCEERIKAKIGRKLKDQRRFDEENNLSINPV